MCFTLPPPQKKKNSIISKYLLIRLFVLVASSNQEPMFLRSVVQLNRTELKREKEISKQKFVSRIECTEYYGRFMQSSKLHTGPTLPLLSFFLWIIKANIIIFKLN